MKGFKCDRCRDFYPIFNPDTFAVEFNDRTVHLCETCQKEILDTVAEGGAD